MGGVVGLEADAVDLDAGVLQHLDDADGGLALGRRALERVVVVVELDVGLDGGGRLEGDLDVLLAKHVVEDGLAVRAVILERLVHHVPRVALAPVVLHDLGHVLHDDRLELLGRPLRLLDPRRQLAVPHERVAPLQDLLLLRDRRHNVALGEVEHAPLGLDEQPLSLLSAGGRPCAEGR